MEKDRRDIESYMAVLQKMFGNEVCKDLLEDPPPYIDGGFPVYPVDEGLPMYYTVKLRHPIKHIPISFSLANLQVLGVQHAVNVVGTGQTIRCFSDYLEVVMQHNVPCQDWLVCKAAADLDGDVIIFLKELIRLWASSTANGIIPSISVHDVEDFVVEEFDHAVRNQWFTFTSWGRCAYVGQFPHADARARWRAGSTSYQIPKTASVNASVPGWAINPPVPLPDVNVDTYIHKDDEAPAYGDALLVQDEAQKECVTTEHVQVSVPQNVWKEYPCYLCARRPGTYVTNSGVRTCSQCSDILRQPTEEVVL